MIQVLTPRMEAAQALLDREYMRPLTLRRIARHVGMPALRLHQEFERTFGEAPRAYLLRRRMEAAQRLLASGMHEEQAAREVGYALVRYFLVDYRRWFGTLPRAPQNSLSTPPTSRKADEEPQTQDRVAADRGDADGPRQHGGAGALPVDRARRR